MHKFSCQNSSLRHFAEHLNLSSLPLPCIPLFLPIPLSLSLSPFSSLPSFLPLFLSSSLPLSLSPSLPLSLTPSLPLSLSPSLPLLSLFSPSLCAIQPGVRRGACVRALPCPRFRAAPTPPHSDAGHARLPRVHGHLRMDAPQDKARLAARARLPDTLDALRRRMAERHAQLERAAGGRDAVQLRQLARAQRGGAAGAAAPRRAARASTGPSSARWARRCGTRTRGSGA
jgi:hypothetical protein